MIPKPPKLEELTEGSQLIAGLGKSTVLADIDFETYSEAGFIWDETNGRYKPPKGATKRGLPAVGVAYYASHPSTEVLSCAYDLKDGRGKRLWRPDLPPPLDLFEHVNAGKLLEAWNCTFEYWIWGRVCTPKYGWPVIRPEQWRDAMAKARAFALPGGLAPAGEVIGSPVVKDKEGKRLLTKFSIPRNPTKSNPARRIRPSDDPQDAELLYQYNLGDIAAEAHISSRVPDLIPNELEFWLCDQAINHRGVAIDLESIQSCIAVVEQAHAKYNAELYDLTGGAVKAASEIQRLIKWLVYQGVKTDTLDADTVQLLLAADLPPVVRRVLMIRDSLASAAVKKIYTMDNQHIEGRLYDLFVYHSARTGRAAANGAQPQNLPSAGPFLFVCTNANCQKHFATILLTCPWCGYKAPCEAQEWSPQSVVTALEVIKTQSVECVEYYLGNPIAAVSGCLRGLFIAQKGHDLICSDYSAIEAVVLAALAKEDWRLEVFRTHGLIYESSAAKITGVSFEEIVEFKQKNGKHHPHRKLGKVAELASGYGGGLGAWKQFGADEFFGEEEIKQKIRAWRGASPNIVKFWGGQFQEWMPMLYGIEGCAIQAVTNPGTEFSYNEISFVMIRDILYCRLLSGRHLTYHRPQLHMSTRRQDSLELSYEGWNTNPKNGAIGWIRMSTYGGKLVENIVQATARDILAHAIVNLEKASYPVVLHIHDEIVAEIPENWGSLEEFERIMSTLPAWASDWPVKAKGGWRAKRYTK